MRIPALPVAAALVVSVAAATAQHYDPYYVLPAETGHLGADVGLVGPDARHLDATSLVPLVAKYAVTDRLELGARADLGVLDDAADDLSAVTLGAKLGLGGFTVLTGAVLLPVADAEDPGLSLGLMHTLTFEGLQVNSWAQVGMLDGYTGGRGANLQLLVEPLKAFGEHTVVYLDLLARSTSDDLGGDLAVDLGPNLDYMLSQHLVVNAGVTLGVAGDRKQDDLGLTVMVLTNF
ncbi:MAG: hypothetical protein ABIL09_23815 [Gemmatimonadota bacterium]